MRSKMAQVSDSYCTNL